MKQLILRSKEDRRITSGHVWIYSNEVDTKASPLTAFTPGEIVLIKNSKAENLGVGYVNPKTLLAARLLSRDPNQKIDQQFFVERIQQALQLRQQFFAKPFYRLVYGESDFLPGLVIDRFDQHLAVQITTAGMENCKPLIQAALIQVLNPKTIVYKNEIGVRELEGLDQYHRCELGELPEVIEMTEGDAKFRIPFHEGQKTGWYYDQAYNRLRIKEFVKNKKVLDVYSYIGAFAIQAALGSAKHIDCVESGNVAAKFLQENIKLNSLENKMNLFHDDAFEVTKNLVQEKKFYDVVMLDPPAFVKRGRDKAEGLKAYYHANQLALKLIDPNGGMLITSSCSMHITQDDLLDILRRSSYRCGREIQILGFGMQNVDHPIHSAIPETNYLKTVFAWVK